MKRFALTAIGRDRPGIVAMVSEALFEHGCNIEDSSMTILQNEFAMILIMSAPDDIDMGSLEKRLRRVEGLLKLAIHLKEIEDTPAERTSESNHMITVSGFDKPGIVYKTADFIAKCGINITDLETKVVPGEDRNIYILLMEVFFPDTVDAKSVEGLLTTLGQSLGVEIGVKPIETYESL